MKKQMLLPFLILAGVPFIMVLGNSMLIPVFPQMEKAMHLTKFQVGLIVTLFSLPAGVLIPFAGALSDHVGRKAVMAPALLVYGCGGLLSGLAALLLAHPYPVVLAGRVVQGIGAGGTYQLAMALAGDIFTSNERTKVLGYLEAANGLGKVLSPILGASLALITWYTPFFAYGLLAIPIALAVWFMVKEDRSKLQPQPPQKYLQALRQVFAAKGGPLAACYMIGAIGLFLLFGLLSFLSDELEVAFGIRGFGKGGVLAIPVGLMALTSFGGGILLQGQVKWLKTAIVTGMAAIVGGLALMSWGHSAVVFTGLAAVVAFGIGLLLPPLNTLITGAVGPGERGLVTCLYGTVRFFGAALGPPAFGLVADAGQLVMFLGGAAIGALGLVISLLWVDTAKMAGEQKGGG